MQLKLRETKLMSMFTKGIVLVAVPFLLNACVAYPAPTPQRTIGYVPAHKGPCGQCVPAHYAVYYVGPSYYPGGAIWIPGHWNRYGQWVPGHWRY